MKPFPCDRNSRLSDRAMSTDAGSTRVA